jgi:cholesterol transport system auxiliary component
MTPRVLFRARRVGLLLACAALSSCALTSKADPMRPRYFTPESAGPDRVPGASQFSGFSLRLGRVVGGANLREQIVYRSSEQELGYYEERRWTERPEVYVRRALSHALFEQRGLTRAVSGVAPTLEVELVAFEEVLAPAHTARFRAIAVLRDERASRFEQTITVERPIAVGKDPQDAAPVVRALAEALQQGVAEISDRVLQQVTAFPQPGPAAGTGSAPGTEASRAFAPE